MTDSSMGVCVLDVPRELRRAQQEAAAAAERAAQAALVAHRQHWQRAGAARPKRAAATVAGVEGCHKGASEFC